MNGDEFSRPGNLLEIIIAARDGDNETLCEAARKRLRELHGIELTFKKKVKAEKPEDDPAKEKRGMFENPQDHE